MMLKRIILFIFTFIYIFYDNWIPTPSCIQQQQHDNLQEEDNDLKVMMVSDLMLSGGSSSSSGYGSYLDLLDLYFKDYYFSRFFTVVCFERPKRRCICSRIRVDSKQMDTFSSTISQLLGPFLDLPYHVVPGDRDIGKCNDLDEVSVNKVTRSFPGLDSSGCGAFDIGNISFVSLNSVALLCGNNALRFSVEKALERERSDMADRKTLAEAGPYELSQTLPPNATEYIFHALRPRMCFIHAHAQTFSDRTHPDGTREIVVPAMSWDTGKDPEFVAVTFRRNGTYALVSHCKLSGRSHSAGSSGVIDLVPLAKIAKTRCHVSKNPNGIRNLMAPHFLRYPLASV
ncbi:metallophosphoesterase 1-like protein [Tanacetum coccineum]|uniref:Metallophosphoesterase 1-like protein n=1 Tax=Tanacetum coccineum TaxID=301880 RepID=A0ABQ5HPI7_9ASTR